MIDQLSPRDALFSGDKMHTDWRMEDLRRRTPAGPAKVPATYPVFANWCPECLQGKHGNCDGTTWDEVTDAPALCPCDDRSHS